MTLLPELFERMLRWWAEALAAYQDSLAIKRELGDRLGEASMLHDLGEWHEKQGQLQDALTHYREALAIRQELTAWPEAGEMWRALAGVYAARGEWSLAAEAARRAAEAWGKVEQSAKMKEVDNES